MIGKRLLHYEVTDRIGAGGMGEVYRATDTRLGRVVAIKVLPADVAGDTQRLARFRREARALAALNHPHVASLFGLEEAEDQPFLVMELVEGKDLRQRLRRGPMRVPEVLEVARQLALGLQEAHACGIVHRDLKPANIKLDPRGGVKILDFGLARLWPGEDGDLSSAPTQSQPTATGVVLGTAAYMSPEQASGKPVDKRSDIWSFGAVLYEMLCGRRPFSGATSGETLASVIKDEPTWERIPADCPPALGRLVRRCLRKDPSQRLQDIGDARWELEEPGAADGFGADERAPRRPGSLLRATAVAGLIGVGLGYAGARATVAVRPADGPAPHLQLTSHMPSDVDVSNGCFSVSPAGRQIALAQAAGRNSMWLAPLDGSPARVLSGGERGQCPSFSPGGDDVVFLKRTRGGYELRRTSIATGATVTLASVPPSGGTIPIPHWGEDGWIVFGVGNRAYRVRESGGEARLVFQPESGSLLSTEPFSGGGRMLAGILDGADTRVAIVDLESGLEVRSLLEGTSHAVVHREARLLFARDGALFAQGFDARLGTLEGPARRLMDVDVFTFFPEADLGMFDVSANGVLVVLDDADLRELTWLDRGGRSLGTLGESGRYDDVALSPDGGSVVVRVLGDEGTDLWVIDASLGLATRETRDAAIETEAIWSRDGRDLYYARDPGGSRSRPWTKRVGTSSATPLLEESAVPAYVRSLSADGRELLYSSPDGEGATTVFALPLSPGGEPRVAMRADHRIGALTVSPDGDWLAYTSDETGEREVYVAPWGGEGRKFPVSNGGGGQPQWRGDGQELFYVTPEGQLMAVGFEGDERVGPRAAEPLFDVGVALLGRQYAPSRDGQRFLVIRPRSSEFKVVLNWPSLLE